MVLHVINSRFVNNHGPSLGPDVAGGAIYAEGSLDVTIVNSTFQSNDASNGGAFGSLQSKVTLVDNVFQSNQAVGHGGNYNIPSSGCPLHLNQYQVGSGGNAGAVYFDGQAAPGISVCGNKFRNNNGTDGLGGALWAAGDPGILNITINQSEFDANKNGKGGGVYGYKTKMVIARSTFVNNSAGNGGAVQTDISTFTSVNNTYSGNSASVSVGTLGLFTTTGTVLNSTFSGNKAPYYPIQFTGSTSTAAPNISFVNNIFSGNVSTSYSVQCQSTLPGANNVAWPVPPRSPATETACASDTMFLDPQLGALSDNGGGILTMPIPLANAAARIGTSNCPTADARGVKRGSVCAAGSFEPK
jgi:hypothetical protein